MPEPPEDECFVDNENVEVVNLEDEIEMEFDENPAEVHNPLDQKREQQNTNDGKTIDETLQRW